MRIPMHQRPNYEELTLLALQEKENFIGQLLPKENSRWIYKVGHTINT